MTPPWVLALVIATQFAVMQIGDTSKPTCYLKFEAIHYSTSVKRNLGTDAVKMNVKSICNSPQRESRLTASIHVLTKGESKIFYKSRPVRNAPNGNNAYEVIFLEFWRSCTKGEVLLLRGEGHGAAFLKNNREVRLSDNTGEFTPVLCDFPAK